MLEMRSTGPTREDIERGYEGTAITVRGFIYFLGVFVVFVLAVHAIIWFLFVGMQGVAETENRARFQPAVLSLKPVPPPAPNLQPSPPHDKVDWRDMDELRTAQEQSLLAARWDRDPRTGRLIVPPQIVEQVGKVIDLSRTAPTTLPYSSGASGRMAPAATPDEPSGPAAPGSPGSPAIGHGPSAEPAPTAPVASPAVGPATLPGVTVPTSPAAPTAPAADSPAATPDGRPAPQPSTPAVPATQPAATQPTGAPADGGAKPDAAKSDVPAPGGAEPAPADRSKDQKGGADRTNGPTVGRENP